MQVVSSRYFCSDPFKLNQKVLMFQVNNLSFKTGVLEGYPFSSFINAMSEYRILLIVTLI